MMRGWTMVVAALLLAACSDDGAPANDGSALAADPSAAAAPAPRVPTPADSAIAVEAGESVTPAPAAAREGGTTPWRALDWPSEPWVQSAATPEALLRRVRDVVAAQLEEPDAGVLPTRMEPEVAGRALGYLVHPDQADDSVRDVEFRLHMLREGSTWTVTGVDRREHCRRGVADGGLCV
jgi:hypothetical protein